jgi:hypothetical protein
MASVPERAGMHFVPFVFVDVSDDNDTPVHEKTGSHFCGADLFIEVNKNG